MVGDIAAIPGQSFCVREGGARVRSTAKDATPVMEVACFGWAPPRPMMAAVGAGRVLCGTGAAAATGSACGTGAAAFPGLVTTAAAVVVSVNSAAAWACGAAAAAAGAGTGAGVGAGLGNTCAALMMSWTACQPSPTGAKKTGTPVLAVTSRMLAA